MPTDSNPEPQDTDQSIDIAGAIENATDKSTGKLDLRKSLIKVQGGRFYLPVQARIIAFRHEHPDWGIHTQAIEINHEKQFAVFQASIYGADGRLMSMGTKKEDRQGFPDWLEKAETGSVGRALNLLGFGTEYATDMEEVTPQQAERGQGRYTDSPQRGYGQSGQSRDYGPYNTKSGGENAQRPNAPRSAPPARPIGPSSNAARSVDTRTGEVFDDGQDCELPLARTTEKPQARQGEVRQGGGLSGKTPEARAVQSVQINIRKERERIWGVSTGDKEMDKQADGLYRDWLERQIGERSLKEAPIEVSRKALKLLEALPQHDYFDDRFTEDQTDEPAPTAERAMAA